MDRAEIIQLLRDFEARSGNPILPWREIDFWPLVRPFLGMELHKSIAFEGLIKPPVSLWSRRAGVVQRMLLRLSAYRRWVRDLEKQRGHALLITRTNRRRLSGGRPFHRMATPLRHFLSEQNVPLSVWDFDTAPYRDPTAIPTQGIVQWQWMFSPERKRSTPPPEGFESFIAFLRGASVKAPEPLHSWPFWQALFGSILFRADRYGTWLKGMKPRIVFVDCWYTSEVLPVIIAARRLNIPVVDLQHGIQGASHFGYAAWPELKDSPLIPDTFWFWGERDRRVFVDASNGLRHLARGIVGGSIELNDVRKQAGGEEKAEVADAAPHSVLISEQKGIDVNAVLVPAIRATAESVQWLIRPHPGQPESGLRAALGPEASRVTFISPGLETVFESLARADVHVTGFSSMALEAMAMGRMTLLCHEAGREIFGDFLERGAMKMTPVTDSLIETIKQPISRSPKDISAGVEDTFASIDATRAALASLLKLDQS
jgi:hypothetical protein